MTTPPNQDASAENVTDIADFKARFNAATAGSGAPDASARGFMDAPLKPLPLLTPPETPVLFRLRVDLADSHPPIWRRLTLPSNLTLDVLHDVLQTAFGWTNSHLHRFALARDRYGHETQGILTPYDVEEGDEGVLESELRLDQLLAKENDWLHYSYDFGDDWDHTIKLRAEGRVGHPTGARLGGNGQPASAQRVGRARTRNGCRTAACARRAHQLDVSPIAGF